MNTSIWKRCFLLTCFVLLHRHVSATPLPSNLNVSATGSNVLAVNNEQNSVLGISNRQTPPITNIRSSTKFKPVQELSPSAVLPTLPQALNAGTIDIAHSSVRQATILNSGRDHPQQTLPKNDGPLRAPGSKSSDDSPTERVDPFSVQIGETKFYGGLITYSHELHSARICRVLNACIRPDGTLVLPEWMRRLDSSLSFHCGHSKLEFSLSDTDRPPHLQRSDLIGIVSPRPSMPHFLEDFIPSTVIFDLIYGDHDVAKSCHSRKGRDCSPFPGLAQGLKPLVQLDPRLKMLEDGKSWVRQFVRLMKPGKRGRQPKIAYNLFPEEGNSDETMKCFRSALFTRGPYSKKLITEDHLRNIHFLRQNGVEKSARNVFLAGKGERDDGRPDCEVNVTISNRKLIDGAHNRLIGRYIMNIPMLRDAIHVQAKRVPGLRINIATMALEGKSLRWQINAMQKTDIWVAGHGSLLTNMIFLRENSTVIEIQPFAYYPRGFEKMAQYLAHVNYDVYIAHPDVHAFTACINQLYPSTHESHVQAVALLQKFSSASDKYKQSDNTHTVTFQNLNDSRLHQVKTCAQMQRLDTNSKNFAIAIVRNARIRCRYPPPPLQDSVH